MIIVRKPPYYGGGSPSIALCEEIKRTEKRVYVRVLAGLGYAIDGNRDNKYADLSTVLTFDATVAMYDEMVALLKAHETRQDELAKLAARERREFNEALNTLAGRVATVNSES